MHWYNYPSYQKTSEAVAEFIFDKLKKAPKSLIGIATGHSPELTYELISKKLIEQPSVKEKIKLWQLDEWLNIGPQHPSSCQYYIQQEIIIPWQLKKEQYTLINGDLPNQNTQVHFLKNKLAHEKMDICILGLGKNGHLALNEPGSRLGDEFRIVKLAKSSQSHGMLQGSKKTIEEGITTGLKEILASKLIVLIITGKGKKEAYQKLRQKEAFSIFPASALYFHNNIHCFVDESVFF